MPNKPAGVVVWYNPQTEHVANIYKYLDGLDKLYVVDNSSDPICAQISLRLSESSKIEYVALGENLGIAAALNIGAEKALAHGYKWILTMDQDSSFDVCIIDTLCRFAAQNSNVKLGIVAAVPGCSAFGDGVDCMGWEFVQSAFTSGNLVNLKAYSDVNGWDERLFIDSVDYDFDFRIQQCGYKIVQINKCIFDHSLGNTKFYKVAGRKLFAATNHNFVRRYYITRNRLYINQKYGRDFSDFVSAERFANIKDLIKIILSEPDKCRKLKSMWRGYRDFRHGIFGRYRW